MMILKLNSNINSTVLYDAAYEPHAPNLSNSSNSGKPFHTDPRAQTLPSPDTTALGNDQRLLYGFAITEEAVFFFEDNANGIVHDSGNNANRNRQHMMRRKYLTMAAACRKVNVWWESSWYEDRNPEVTPCKDDILYFAVVSKHSAHLESAPLKEVLLKIGEQLDLGEPEWILV